MTKGHLRSVLFMFAGLTASLAQAQTMQSSNNAFLERICNDNGQSARHAQFVDWLEVRLQLNETQKAAFKAFQDARTASISDAHLKLCASKPDMTSFAMQVTFNQTLLETRVEALKAENPKLIAFFNTLSDSQKATFETTRRSLHN